MAKISYNLKVHSKAHPEFHPPSHLKRFALLLRLNSLYPVGLLWVPIQLGSIYSNLDAYELFIQSLCNLGYCLLLRSLGCVINDLWDHNFDKLTLRGSGRMLASGKVSVVEAAGVACILGLAALYLGFMHIKAPYLILSCAALITIYPSAKRWTNFPQLCLGCIYNYGFWIMLAHHHAANASQALQRGPFSFETLLVYLGLVSWTVFYDSIYAAADLEDDRRLGLGSAVKLFHNNFKSFLYVCLLIQTSTFICAGIYSVIITSSFWLWYLNCYIKLKPCTPYINSYSAYKHHFLIQVLLSNLWLIESAMRRII